MEWTQISALELGQKIKDRELSCEEAASYAITRIKAAEPATNAFITVLEEDAVKQQARDVQKRLDSGEALSPLAGVPMAVKDNICTEGILTSCGSNILTGFKPPYSATAWKQLRKAGAVLLGKTNMDEFAMGGSSETSFYGAAKNPWDLERVPGGSSGGSAAAVAAGEAFYALGSDTGGSVRQPCAFCGISGIKPTYGAVSRFGLVAYASSLDQIGPMGRTVQDCAEVLKVLDGHDEQDSTSVKKEPWDFTKAYSGDVKGIKVGIPSDYFGEGLDSDVKAAVLEAAETLKRLGAELVEVALPIAEYAIPAYYIVACAEASSNLSRYDGVKYGRRSSKAENLYDVYADSRSEGFGLEVKRRIMLGSFVLSSGYYDAYYKKALQVREMIQKSFHDAFTGCDMILCPNAPTTAYKLGENISDPLKMYLGDVYTVSVNLAGLPAVTVPCGFDQKGLPVGLQLIGKPFDEASLIQAAHGFQSATDHHKKRSGNFADGTLTQADRSTQSSAPAVAAAPAQAPATPGGKTAAPGSSSVSPIAVSGGELK